MSHHQTPGPELELESLVQSFRQLLDHELSHGLPGTLKILEQRPTAAKSVEVFRGSWEPPDKAPMLVFIKRVELSRASVKHDQVKERIQRETAIWTMRAHPNILPFVGCQVNDESLILVSSWQENGNICEYIENNPETSRKQKITMLRDAASGLRYLHNLNPRVVHGDIKPENVLIQNNLGAVLCDFGISTEFLTPDEYTGSTTPEDQWGSIGYLAKELLDEQPPTPATDIFALAGVILTTLSGKRPFWQKTHASATIAVITNKTPVPEHHPALPASDGLWNVLYNCWEPDPTKRPTTSEILDKLSCEIDLLPPNEPPPLSEPPTQEEESPPPTPSTDNEESLVRPGYFVFACELPPPIQGTLTKIKPLAVQGAHGDVYRGSWNPPDGDPIPVVIKCVRPPLEGEEERFRTRVKRETVIWSMVTHRNILPFIGYQIVDEVAMLVSPWCKNGNLATYIAAHPKLVRNDKLRLLCGAAYGLIHLHSLNPPIFHGDIKPQNVIVRDTLEAVLCDFGISRVILNPGEHSGLTTSDTCSGTMGYQAKEILDEGQPTTATDVFAFSGLMLATLSGKPPFWRKKIQGKILAIYNGHMPSPTDHPTLPETDPLWALMRECWSPEPASRPHTTALSNFLESETTDRS